MYFGNSLLSNQHNPKSLFKWNQFNLFLRLQCFKLHLDYVNYQKNCFFPLYFIISSKEVIASRLELHALATLSFGGPGVNFLSRAFFIFHRNLRLTHDYKLKKGVARSAGVGVKAQKYHSFFKKPYLITLCEYYQ